MPKECFSVLWHHFDKVTGVDLNKKLATCKYCKINISYKGTTTNLKSHLKLKHADVFSTLITIGHSIVSGHKSLGADDGIAIGGGGDVGHSDSKVHSSGNQNRVISTTTSGDTLSSNEPSHKVRRLMTSDLPKKILPSNTKGIDKALVKLIAYDCQPFTIVDDIGFKEFVHKLNPSYVLPSRQTLSSSLLPAFYEDRRKYLMNFVKRHAESVCLTVDCWTSRTKDKYMEVTAHFFSNDLEIKNVLLQCDLLGANHTGVRIADELRSIVEEWEISNKIVVLVTDNDKNMLSASRILQWNHFGCFERKLHLVVQDALHAVKDTIEKVTKTVFYFKKSKMGKDELIKYQLHEQNVQQPRTLTKAISTRWNSTYLMLERFHSLKEAIRATVATLNVSLPSISNDEWICIEQLCMTLKPFHDVSNVMSGENYLNASTAMVLTSSLISICEDLSTKTNLCTPVINLLGNLKQGLTQRLGNIQNDLNIAICTLLDPRFKDLAFEDTQSLEKTKSYTLTLMKSYFTDDDKAEFDERVNSSAVDDIDIWRKIDTKMTSSNAPKTAENKAQDELKLYFKESLINRNACHLTWWKNHQYIYPVLYKIFKTKCNLVVSSVPCERAFSKAGYILNERRTHLATSKVGKIVFLNVNKLN